MNILLLGNGFDLYHKLPTRYDNFLHTVDFLIKNYKPDIQSVADVFNELAVGKENHFIFECYLQHKHAYENTKLEKEKIDELIELTQNNIWFSYLYQSFNKEVGWIDLEREIAFVLDSFKEFFSSPHLQFNIAKKMPSIGYRYVIEQFDFFIEPIKSTGMVNGPTHKVKPEYIITIPINSKNILIDKEKIIFELSKKLDDLTMALRLYLQYFVENTLEEIKQNSLSKCSALDYIENTITFNYTNTYEKCYFLNDTFHLHGNISEKIILGINPDISDNLESIDTSFVKFKKYFQRADFETDKKYNRWLSLLDEKDVCCLIVMGHSLDITDKDIIVPLFRKMNEITILYHSSAAKKDYIKNLIQMFGMEEFEELRTQRSLSFLPLDIDFTDFKLRLSRTWSML